MDKNLMRVTIKEIYRCCDNKALEIIKEAEEIDNAEQLVKELESYIKERDYDEYQLPARDSDKPTFKAATI